MLHPAILSAPASRLVIKFSSMHTSNPIASETGFVDNQYKKTDITLVLRMQDGKEAAEDDLLPDGTFVKKRTHTGYVPYSMGRMKFLWGDDALEFKPDRWLEDGLFQPQSPFKFSAFQVSKLCSINL